MEIIKAYFNKHPCMGKKMRAIRPIGILVHSTGSVNRELRRYVDEPERLGKNLYNNHWNKTNATKSVHAFIGYDKDKHVIVAETLPHQVACWGCGGGKKGSYNYDPHAYLQFEICQGSTSDPNYYWQAIKVAEEYCAHLCRIYGWTANNITSHAEACSAGYASNHGDPASWMKAFGDDMNKFRMRVKALLDADKVSEAETQETTPALPFPVGTKIVTITGDSVNVRLGDSMDYGSTGRVDKGTVLAYVATSTTGWYAVRKDDRILWVSNEFSKIGAMGG